MAEGIGSGGRRISPQTDISQLKGAQGAEHAGQIQKLTKKEEQARVTHVKDEAKPGALKHTGTIDAPKIEPPKKEFTPTEQKAVNQSVIDKTKKPVDAKALEAKLASNKLNFQQKMKAIKQEGDKILASNMSPEGKLVEIMKLIKKVVNMSMETEMKAAQAEADLEADQAIEAEKSRMDAEAAKRAADRKKGGLFGKIMKWALPALALVAAVAICVCTGGLAAGPALLLAAAVIGMAFQVANETGGTKAFSEGALAPMFEGFGMDPQKAKMAAAITTAVLVTVIMIGLSIAGASKTGGLSAIKDTAAIVDKIVTIIHLTQMATQVAGTVGQAAINIQIAKIQKAMAGHESDQVLHTKMKEQHGHAVDKAHDHTEWLIKYLQQIMDMASKQIQSKRRAMGAMLKNLA